jgi:hypothetical protein
MWDVCLGCHLQINTARMTLILTAPCCKESRSAAVFWFLKRIVYFPQINVTFKLFGREVHKLAKSNFMGPLRFDSNFSLLVLFLPFHSFHHSCPFLFLSSPLWSFFFLSPLPSLCPSSLPSPAFLLSSHLHFQPFHFFFLLYHFLPLCVCFSTCLAIYLYFFFCCHLYQQSFAFTVCFWKFIKLCGDQIINILQGNSLISKLHYRVNWQLPFEC